MGPIICDVAGLSLNAQDKEIIMHPLVGGIILFSRNYESPEQLRNLIESVRTLRSEFLISVDQEGGRVQRLRSNFSDLPPLGNIGKLLDNESITQNQVLDYAHCLGQLMALEVQHYGIDISFAPVVDCDKGISAVIGNRAFHSDPIIVEALAQAYIQGMGKAGMSATLKHFPGHGGVELDSHYALPIDKRTWLEIEQDMLPFKNLIQKMNYNTHNLNNIHSVMPAHIIFEAVDNMPVGFSKIWLHDILRKKLGFTGLIMSDDLCMEATSYLGDMHTRVILALEAGCDNVLICNNQEVVQSVLGTVKDIRSQESKMRLKMLLAKRKKYKKLEENIDWQTCIQMLENVG